LTRWRDSPVHRVSNIWARRLGCYLALATPIIVWIWRAPTWMRKYKYKWRHFYCAVYTWGVSSYWAAQFGSLGSVSGVRLGLVTDPLRSELSFLLKYKYKYKQCHL